MTEKPAVEEKVEEPEVEEPKPPEPPEKSPLEQKREDILKEDEEPPEEKEKPEEKKPEGEFEVQDVDWDALGEKYPTIKKLNLMSPEELAKSYDGGYEQWQRDRQYIAELEKLGYDTREKREEVLAKLRAKEDIAPPAKPEPEKTSRQSRSERLAKFIPRRIRDPDTIDPDTEEVSPGKVRPITEEEKVAKQKEFDSFAEAISPGDLPDTVDRLEIDTLNQQDELAWILFRLQPLLEEHKDKILPNDIRKQILDHSEKFPRTYAEIVENARKKGQNHYEAVYHHFITTTKRDQIDVEKKKRWEAEHSREEEKKRAAKVETAKRADESLEPSKTFGEKSVMAKRKAIVDAGG